MTWSASIEITRRVNLILEGVQTNVGTKEQKLNFINISPCYCSLFNVSANFISDGTCISFSIAACPRAILLMVCTKIERACALGAIFMICSTLSSIFNLRCYILRTYFVCTYVYTHTQTHTLTRTHKHTHSHAHTNTQKDRSKNVNTP